MKSQKTMWMNGFRRRYMTFFRGTGRCEGVWRRMKDRSRGLPVGAGNESPSGQIYVDVVRNMMAACSEAIKSNRIAMDAEILVEKALAKMKNQTSSRQWQNGVFPSGEIRVMKRMLEELEVIAGRVDALRLEGENIAARAEDAPAALAMAKEATKLNRETLSGIRAIKDILRDLSADFETILKKTAKPVTRGDGLLQNPVIPLCLMEFDPSRLN